MIHRLQRQANTRGSVWITAGVKRRKFLSGPYKGHHPSQKMTRAGIEPVTHGLDSFEALEPSGPALNSPSLTIFVCFDVLIFSPMCLACRKYVLVVQGIFNAPTIITHAVSTEYQNEIFCSRRFCRICADSHVT